MSSCRILGTTVTSILPQLQKELLSSHPAAPWLSNQICEADIPLRPHALGQDGLFWPTEDFTVACASTVLPDGCPCPTEEHTQSTACLKSQPFASWAKGKVSALQCPQPRRTVWLRTKSKFSLPVYWGISLGLEEWRQVLSCRFALNRFVENTVPTVLGSFTLQLPPSCFLWHMRGESWVHHALNTTTAVKRKDETTEFSNCGRWLLTRSSGLSPRMQTRLFKSDGSHSPPHTVCTRWQAMISRVWWEKAPKHKSHFPARVKGECPGFLAFILSLTCRPPVISSKFFCHFPSLHQPIMRISWLPATRKVIEMRQPSLSAPNQVIQEFPFCHFWVSEDLTLGRPLGVVFCPPTTPSNLSEDVLLVRGHPTRPYSFNSDLEASWNPLGKQRRLWAFPSHIDLLLLPGSIQ